MIKSAQAITITTPVKKWGDARSYDLCLNTSQISVEDSIELILKYRECMRNHNK